MNERAEQQKNERWIELMRAGQFDAAWLLSDEHLATKPWISSGHLPLHLRSIWNGESVAGKTVLVHCYHGLGDTLQFIRYTRLLKDLDCTVCVSTQPTLLPLLSDVPSIDDLRGQGTTDSECDVAVELMELPYVFRTTLDDATIQTASIGKLGYCD